MKPILHDLDETSRLALASLLALALHGTLLFGIPTERWWHRPVERPSFEVALLPPLQQPSTLDNGNPEKPADPTTGSSEHTVVPIASDSVPSPPIPAAISLPVPEFVGPSQPVVPTKPKPPFPAKPHPTPVIPLALKPAPKNEPVAHNKARVVKQLPIKPISPPELAKPGGEKPLAVTTKPPVKQPTKARHTAKSIGPAIEPDIDEIAPSANIPALPGLNREPQAVATTRSTTRKNGRQSLDSSALLGQIASMETQAQRQAHAGVRAKRVNPNDAQSLEGFYIGSWVRKVEQIGEMNFPDVARRLNLSAGPTLEVAIRADGSLQDVRVARSSGNPELDQAAQRIVRLGAPYAAFPPQLRQQYDVLYISRPWRFESSGRLRMR